MKHLNHTLVKQALPRQPLCSRMFLLLILPSNPKHCSWRVDCAPTLLYINYIVLSSSSVVDKPSAYEFTSPCCIQLKEKVGGCSRGLRNSSYLYVALKRCNQKQLIMRSWRTELLAALGLFMHRVVLSVFDWKWPFLDVQMNQTPVLSFPFFQTDKLSPNNPTHHFIQSEMRSHEETRMENNQFTISRDSHNNNNNSHFSISCGDFDALYNSR